MGEYCSNGHVVIKCLKLSLDNDFLSLILISHNSYQKSINRRKTSLKGRVFREGRKPLYISSQVILFYWTIKKSIMLCNNFQNWAISQNCCHFSITFFEIFKNVSWIIFRRPWPCCSLYLCFCRRPWSLGGKKSTLAYSKNKIDSGMWLNSTLA